MDVQGNVTISVRDDDAVPSNYFNVWKGAVELRGGITVPNSKIIYLSGTSTVFSSAGGDNVWNGPVRLHYASGARTINVETGSSMTLGQGIARTASHEHDLSKTGEGKLVIPVASGYVGQTFIDAGVVNIRHGGALGTGGHTTTVGDGAALEMQGDIAVGQGLAISGAGVAGSGALRSLGGTNTWNGNVSLSSATIGVDSGTLTINGQMTGTGTFAKTGSGTLVLTGDNTYAGQTSVSAGTLNIRHNNALGTGGHTTTVGDGAALEMQGDIAVGQGLSLSGLGLADAGALRSRSGDNVWNGDISLNSTSTRIAVDSGTLTVNGQISGSGTFQKTGAGTLVVTAANTYTGQTQIRAGTLQLAGGDNRLATTNNMRIEGPGTFDLNGRNQTLNALTLAASGRVQLSGNAMLTVNSGDFWNSGNAISGTGRLIKTGSSYLTFGVATADYTGGTFIDSGKLWLYQGDNKLPITGDVTIAGSGTLDLAHSNTPGAVQTIGGLFGAGTVSIGVAGKAVNFIVGNGDREGNFSGILQDGSGTLSLTKAGVDTLRLSGASTYTGGTVVGAGALLVSNTAGSATGAGPVSVNQNAALGGTGSIGGPVNVGAGGILAPGGSVGTLHLQDDLAFAEGAFFDVDIEELGFADLVEMDGGLLAPNGATIRVNLGFSPELGHSWTILQGEGARDGIFDTNVAVLTGSEFLGGWKRFEVGYQNSVVLTVVPEPGAVLLLACAVACGLLVRRRIHDW